GIFTLYGHAHPVSCVAFSPDGTRIATASGDQSRPGEVKVWDARTGTLLLELDGLAPMRRVGNIAVLNVAFSPDGSRLATAGGVTGAGEATVWDAKTGKALLELKAPAGPARCVAFSADGTRVVTGHDGQPGGVTVWDARTGKALLELTGHRH